MHLSPKPHNKLRKISQIFHFNYKYRLKYKHGNNAFDDHLKSICRIEIHIFQIIVMTMWTKTSVFTSFKNCCFVG